jgi:hypothetical protein
MRVSLLTRVGSAVAAAALATTGAMAITSAADAAATHVRKLPTSLSIRLVHHPRHHFDVVSGQLKSHQVPLRDKVVLLERRTAGKKFHVVAREVTGRHGFVAFPVAPKATSRFVLVFRSTPNFRHSHSGVVTVKVKA